jgi:hypothetical protein
MSKKRGNIYVEETFLRSVALPQATDTYTVIGHGTIIDKVRDELTKNNFEVTEEVYAASIDGEIALGKVYIKSDKDPDMGMIFTWWNSYNKRVKFGCAVGSFIYDNKASLIGSEGMSWIRKHTGTADQEANSIIEQLIEAADTYFDKIIAEKNRMKAMPLSIEDYGCVMGALYFEHELITPTQASAIIAERKKPTHTYSDQDNLWGLYKILMFGIENMDITKWVKSQQKLHHMIMAEYAIKVTESSIKEPIALDISAAGEVDERAVWAEQELAKEPTGEDVGPPEMYQGDAKPIMFENKEAFVDQIIKQYDTDKPLAEYYADNHYDENKSAQENMDGFAEYSKGLVKEYVEIVPEAQGKPLAPGQLRQTEPPAVIPARILTEDQIEVVKEEHGKEDVSNTFEASETSDDELDLFLSVDDDVREVLDNIDEPVEIIEPTDDFVFPTDLDNKEKLEQSLEVPAEVIAQAKEIEERMKKLYGSVRPYHLDEDEDLVIIDETLECFSI